MKPLLHSTDLVLPLQHSFAMFPSDLSCDRVWGLGGAMLASTYKICNQQGPKVFVNVKDVLGH